MERKKPKNISKQIQPSRDDLVGNPKAYKGNYPSGSLDSRGLESNSRRRMDLSMPKSRTRHGISSEEKKIELS